MPTRRKTIYFLSLELENVRCFAVPQVLSLVDSRGRPARWTLLVGDNGVGKTTLLQCLAWMRPTPYYPTATEQEGIQPLLHDQDPPVMARLLREGAGITTLRAEMVQIRLFDVSAAANSACKNRNRGARKKQRVPRREAHRKRAKEDGRSVHHYVWRESAYGAPECRQIA